MALTAGQVVDETDRALMDRLVADGRMSVSRLAHEVGISRANAYQRLDRLQETGVITGFSARLDPRKLGRSVAALVLVNIEQHSWRDLQQRFLRLHGLEHLAVTTGAFDFALLIRVPDVETLRDVVLEELHGIDGVRSTQTVFVLDDVRPVAT